MDEICSFDRIAQQEGNRAEFIKRSILAKSCYAAIDGQIKGYAILEYSFFEQGFVSMLYVHPDW